MIALEDCAISERITDKVLIYSQGAITPNESRHELDPLHNT